MSSGNRATCSMRFKEDVMEVASMTPVPGGKGVNGPSKEDPIVTTVVVTPRAIPNFQNYHH